MSDLMFRPVHELAAMVRSGELSARELVQESLDRIEALDDEVGAFVDVDAEGALAAAGEIAAGDERPFAGVPIAIKNNKPVAGKRLTFCAELMGDFVPGHDAFVVRRLREAGFVIVGTTKLPEYGPLCVTEPVRFGPSRNPWDLERTPGGSSGGSAAAVAAGMLPIAHGNDGGGSIRIPAACCGLVGLKPARGRVSHGPDLGDSFLGMDGVLTRTTGESAAVLDVIAGYEPGDANWAPPPAEPFADAAARPPEGLRIALTTEPPVDGIELDPLAAEAVRDTASLLEELGHHVEEIGRPAGAPDVVETFKAVFGPLVSMGIGFAALLAQREPTADDMEAVNWELWQLSRTQDSLTYLNALNVLQALTRMVVGMTAQYDVVLTPALAQRPVPLGTIDGTSPDAAAVFRRMTEFTPYTALANITGQPAIAVPIAHGEDGLPLAVQFIGRPADEATLLALSAQLEAARPWADRRAPIAAPAEA